MTATETNRLITVELCQRNGEGDCSVKEYERLTAAEAKERLSRKMTNRHFYRVQPADKTGAIAGDDERYESDMDAVDYERISDPNYTPTLDEALRHPDAFVDGMIES